MREQNALLAREIGLAPGDYVTLPPFESVMVVSHIGRTSAGKYVTCVWFIGGAMHQHSFPPAILRKIESPKAD